MNEKAPEELPELLVIFHYQFGCVHFVTIHQAEQWFVYFTYISTKSYLKKQGEEKYHHWYLLLVPQNPQILNIASKYMNQMRNWGQWGMKYQDNLIPFYLISKHMHIKYNKNFFFYLNGLLCILPEKCTLHCRDH